MRPLIRLAVAPALDRAEHSKVKQGKTDKSVVPCVSRRQRASCTTAAAGPATQATFCSADGESSTERASASGLPLVVALPTAADNRLVHSIPSVDDILTGSAFHRLASEECRAPLHTTPPPMCIIDDAAAAAAARTSG